MHELGARDWWCTRWVHEIGGARDWCTSWVPRWVHEGRGARDGCTSTSGAQVGCTRVDVHEMGADG